MHLLHCLDLLCSFCAFSCKESPFCVMTFKNNTEYSEDLYCIKDVLCFLRFLHGCHHRWSNEDFLWYSTVVKGGNRQKAWCTWSVWHRSRTRKRCFNLLQPGSLVQKLATCLSRGKTVFYKRQWNSQRCFCMWCATGIKAVVA